MYDTYASAVSRPGGPLDADSVRVYCSRVRQYLAWLATADIDGDALHDAAARDWAVRDYRTHLLTIARRQPSTVNAHLTAVDDFYRRLGLGPAAARREDLPKAAPRALDKRAQLRWLRAAEQAATRDRTLALAGFYAGLRIGEIVGLDLDDIRSSARKGHLVVRQGKGGRYREAPLHPAWRATVEAWRKERTTWPQATTNPAVFLNRRGVRLSTRGAYDALAGIAEAAGIDVGRNAEFTPHVLRHTAGTTMTRAGTDIILVAEILGHSVETARRYALPTQQDRQAAIERLTTDQ
ncbi:MAG: tyrosine-type recombinase/integrase [Acidimicrobiales bacterium]